MNVTTPTSIPISILLTPEVLSLILALLIAIGSAIYFIVVTRTKMKKLEDDVKDLLRDARSLDIRIESHIRSVEARQESERIGRESRRES